MKKILSTKEIVLCQDGLFLCPLKIQNMKKLVLIFCLTLPVYLSAQTLPKECYGFYAGEMAAYSVIVNDVEMNIEKHDVEVHVADNIFPIPVVNLR